MLRINEGRKSMKEAVVWLVAVVALIALGWIFAGNDLAMQRVFAPAREQVRRETFEESKAYRDGVIQEIRSMQFEYLKADDAHKAAMGAVIRHKLAGFPADALPPDLQQFVVELP
jgi:hypothetical protein